MTQFIQASANNMNNNNLTPPPPPPPQVDRLDYDPFCVFVVI
jgi:hypothetical protein